MNYLTNRKTAIVFLVAVFIVFSVIFREKVSRFLSFGGNEPRVLDSSVFKAPLQQDNNVKVSSSVETHSAVTPSLPKSRVLTSGGFPAPEYYGRDPEEIRPIEKDTKLFTQEQKDRLYSTIRTHAKAVKTNPAYFEGWIQIGLLKQAIGDFEGTRDVWEYAGLIEPKNSVSFSNLGELYWRYLHDYPKSEKNFRTSVLHSPDDLQNYVSLAELYHYSYKEKAEFADEVLLEGLSKNPGAENLMRRLAHLYEQRKEWKNALEWWEKVLAQSPDDQAVKDSIAKARLRVEEKK